MDRDVLLLLLAGGVLLNLGLLVLVALLRAAPWGQPAVERGPDQRERRGRPLPPVTRSVPQPLPVPAARRPPAEPVPAAPAVPAPAVPAPAAPAVPAPADPAVRVSPPAATPPAGTPAAAPSEPDATPSEPRRPTPGRRPSATPMAVRRPRRFTMPDLEEDHERAARSIAAFLGEPVAPSGGARPHRRRHRARRPAGTTQRTDLILVVRGEAVPGRVARAVAAALRDTVRESDDVVELPGARLRVTLDADPAGSEAFLARARVVVRPWLELVGPSLELELADGLPEERAAPAAS